MLKMKSERTFPSTRSVFPLKIKHKEYTSVHCMLLIKISYFFQDACLYSCLQLHVVSMCVHVLGSSFKPLLQSVVYPLLQRLGNEQVSIATAAHATLKYTAAQCGYK